MPMTSEETVVKSSRVAVNEERDANSANGSRNSLERREGQSRNTHRLPCARKKKKHTLVLLKWKQMGEEFHSRSVSVLQRS